MDTKHINDPLDATAIEAKELAAQLEIRDDDAPQKGPSVLRLVEDSDGEAAPEAGTDSDFGQEESAAGKKADAPRGQYMVHRLAGRTVFKPRSRR